MTQEQIDAIDKSREDIRQLRIRQADELHKAYQDNAKLEGACDHTDPDGSSAVEKGGMFFSQCTICHLTDL